MRSLLLAALCGVCLAFPSPLLRRRKRRSSEDVPKAGPTPSWFDKIHNIRSEPFLNGKYVIRDLDIAYSLGKNYEPCPNNVCLWPMSEDGVVYIPYSLSSDFGSFDNIVITSSLKNIEDVTCLRFRKRTTETDYINFVSSTGCWSRLGRDGGPQSISLDKSGCLWTGVVTHEVLHAVGLHHEHVRNDRDKYVQIQWDNIQSDKKSNFQEVNTYNQDLTTYDYNSIMHYTKRAFSIDGILPTIVAVNDITMELGDEFSMSYLDILKINRLYNCKNKSASTTTTTTPRTTTTTTPRTTTTTTPRTTTTTTPRTTTTTTPRTTTTTTPRTTTTTTPRTTTTTTPRTTTTTTLRTTTTTTPRTTTTTTPRTTTTSTLRTTTTTTPRTTTTTTPRTTTTTTPRTTTTTTPRTTTTTTPRTTTTTTPRTTTTTTLRTTTTTTPRTTTTTTPRTTTTSTLRTTTTTTPRTTTTTTPRTTTTTTPRTTTTTTPRTTTTTTPRTTTSTASTTKTTTRTTTSTTIDVKPVMTFLNGCGGNLTEPEGVFTSPNFPSNYPNNAYCHWNITTNGKFRVTFTDFNIETVGTISCLYDKLKIYNGRDFNVMYQFKDLCGQNLPSPITSYGNSMQFLFISDAIVQRKGFRLVYQPV